MDDSCEVGTVAGSRRVERAGEQPRSVFTVERSERDVGSLQQFARLAGAACERDLGKLRAAVARAEHEHDAPPVQGVCLAELAQERGVVERRTLEPCGCRDVADRGFDLVRVWAQRDPFASDVELHGLGETVEEALEGGDERCLFGGASQFEAGAARAEQAAVAAVCEFDQPAFEDATDGNVESGRLRLPRRAREAGHHAFGRE
jgi:hypothetical protein